MSALTRLTGQVMRGLLVPKPVVVQEAAGFKVRKFLKLRCQYCYFVRVNGRMHVECTAQGRHKQREPFNVKLLW
ncbi:hypothetical protein WR25_04696 [Diploscapter pachys]|uniref:Ribosomal protein n=1 Tax=Diploscapter pachys TaxID=2018661 RepID=A0A2A2J6F9_9BILA|nr:hypothetical protein WR25_04696 [Diploscapter pachys]